MREILFRAKDIDTKEWRFGQYIHLHKTTHCFKEDNDADKDNDIHQIVFEHMTDWNLPNQHLRADIDINTLGQFTGLYDKNGKRIFEGDIIMIKGIEACVVKQKRCRFAFVPTCNAYCELSIQQIEELTETDFEIIGNIYDNPELLEK